MNTINNNPSRINWNNKNYNNNVNTEVQNKGQRLNDKTHDRIEISTEGINAYKNNGNRALSSKEHGSAVTNSMDNLVSSGVISRAQQTTVKNALETSKKTLIEVSGTYTNKYFNPLDKLVLTGAINEDQKKAIQGAFAEEKQARISQVNNGGVKSLQLQMEDLNKNTHLSPMDNLIAAGIMMQDEKRVIQSAFSV